MEAQNSGERRAVRRPTTEARLLSAEQSESGRVRYEDADDDDVLDASRYHRAHRRFARSGAAWCCP